MGEWKEYKEITDSFVGICKYDQDSSYFRYPITKNNSLDSKKYSIKKLDEAEIESFLNNKNEKKDNESNKSKVALFLIDEDENIVEAYGKKENILADIRDSLREVATYFQGIHAMVRMTLCKGK